MIDVWKWLCDWLFPPEELTKTFVVYSSDNNRMDENGGPYEVVLEKDYCLDEDVEYLDNIGNL